MGHSVRFPHTITANFDDETYCWLKQEVENQHRTLGDYVRHIILTYKQAKEAKIRKEINHEQLHQRQMEVS